MNLNQQIALIIFLTSLILTKQASCVPFRFLFPEKSSLSPSPSPSLSPATSPISSSPLASNEVSIKSLLNDMEKPDLIVPQKVVEACKKTDYPDECSASIMAPLLENGKYDPISIFNDEIKAFDHALEVVNDGISNDIVDDKQAISICKEMYENAREEINKAMELAGNDKYGASIRLSAALTFVDTCDDGLPHDHDGEGDSTLVETNKLLSKLASNSMALGNLALGFDNDDI